MAGHSKWHNIRHRKAGQDAKRGKVFTKIIREIMVAAREGGGIIEDNPSLRNVVDKAKGAQMPKDTIERAIARGAGGGEGAFDSPGGGGRRRQQRWHAVGGVQGDLQGARKRCSAVVRGARKN